MADKGPVRKRDEQRIRRNKDEVETETVTEIGPVEIPELGIPDAHPFVTEMYESMKKSGQRKFFEPTDWSQAKITLHFLNKLLWSPKPSAQQLANVVSMLGNLLVTEGDRRRARVEVERKEGPAGGAEVKPITDAYMQIFAQQQQTNLQQMASAPAPETGSSEEG
jgi:hypothetical protein